MILKHRNAQILHSIALPSLPSSPCLRACARSLSLLSIPLCSSPRSFKIHTTRYIDFQITKLKKYAQDGTPISSSGIASLLAKPHVTIPQAKELLQLAKNANCVTTSLFNDYIGALSANGDVDFALEAVKNMEQLGLEPNIRTYNTMLHLVISTPSLFLSILSQIRQKNLEFDVATYNLVMRQHSMAGDLDRSVEIEALMEQNGVAPNVITYNQLLHIWAKRKEPTKCNEILDKMRARNIRPTLASYTILIQLHVTKLKDIETGLRLFSDMKAQGIVPDSRPYDILIEDLTARGDSQRSLELFHEMQQAGCAEGTMAYSVFIDKFTKEGKFEEGWQMFNEMKAAKEPLRPELWNVFLRFFAQRGDLAQSLVIFEDMNAARVAPSTQTYNVLLSATGMTLDAKLQVWQNMKDLGVERDRFTFNIMIGAYLKERRYAESEAIFNEMSQVNVQPDPHLLMTMRDVYQRSGQMEKAQAMSAAAKKIVRQNLDLREVVRKKQQRNQLQKRIDYQKDIQEIEMLLSKNKTQDNTNQTIQQEPTEPQTLQIQPENLQEQQISEPLQNISEPLSPSEPSQNLSKPPPDPQSNFYPSFYYNSSPPSYMQYQPLYYVPYQTQYAPPSASPSSPLPPLTQQQGLPRRRRGFNQPSSPPPSYAQYNPQDYWHPPPAHWPASTPEPPPTDPSTSDNATTQTNYTTNNNITTDTQSLPTNNKIATNLNTKNTENNNTNNKSNSSPKYNYKSPINNPTNNFPPNGIPTNNTSNNNFPTFTAPPNTEQFFPTFQPPRQTPNFPTKNTFNKNNR